MIPQLKKSTAYTFWFLLFAAIGIAAIYITFTTDTPLLLTSFFSILAAGVYCNKSVNARDEEDSIC